MSESGPRIFVTADGPYFVRGVPVRRMVIVADEQGESVGWADEGLVADEDTVLCRCGASSAKPHCDGSHAHVGFKGTETADRSSYEDSATVLPGHGIHLTDDPSLCAEARHCHTHGAIWHEIDQTGDRITRERVVAQTQMCPSGRYVAHDDASGRTLEPSLTPSVALVEDPVKSCSGPLWLRGGVPVESADGSTYEIRNRVTLCRCGASGNKPFCDGSHIATGFREQEHDD